MLSMVGPHVGRNVEISQESILLHFSQPGVHGRFFGLRVKWEAQSPPHRNLVRGTVGSRTRFLMCLVLAEFGA